jgi:nitrate reductase NapE component
MPIEFRFPCEVNSSEFRYDWIFFRQEDSSFWILIVCVHPLLSRDSSVSIVLGYGLEDGDSRFDSRRGLGIFLFTTASRTALVPTQPPIQWVPGTVSAGLKRPGREAEHSPPSTPPIRLYDVVLS